MPIQGLLKTDHLIEPGIEPLGEMAVAKTEFGAAIQSRRQEERRGQEPATVTPSAGDGEAQQARSADSLRTIEAFLSKTGSWQRER